MIDIVFEDDIREQVETECEFTLEDEGIGHYEYGDGKYYDRDIQLTLTPSSILVQYHIEPESAIIILVYGTYTEDDHECCYMAELDNVVYNKETKTWDATYEVYQD